VLLLLAESQLSSKVFLFAPLNAPGETGHVRFWSAVAFLALLQVTAAVLNLLPIPGLDGYGIVEPHLDADTVRAGDKIKPWGLLIVIALLLWATPVRNAFFDLVNAIYRGIGGTEVFPALGHEFFRWWAKNPL
jgi:Zn-dependent protease